MKEKIFVALDGLSREKALELADVLHGAVGGFKVNDLLLDCGLDIVRALKRYGKVFADPKLHDIPHTVGNSVKKLAAAGADYITVHASGGRAMLGEAARHAGGAKILAVTLLTSLAEQDALEIYRAGQLKTVLGFAALAKESGVHGIVCSPRELEALGKNREFSTLLKVTPGIRPAWYQKATDQARTDSPAAAIKQRADILVIGRPIIEHSEPRLAAQLVAEELARLY